MLRALIATLFLVTVCGLAHAEELQYDQVDFSVAAETELQNDLAEVTLAAEAEHADPAQLAAEINRAMDWALTEARKSAAIEARSGDYQTFPVYDKNRLLSWRAAQSLVLRSENIASLNAVAGALQQKLQIKSMRFLVSPAKQRAAETQLLDQLMDNFKERAARIQRGLGAKAYRIVRLSVQRGGAQPPVIMQSRMAMAEMDSPAPVASEAGSSHASVTAQAVIQLLF